MKKIKLPLLCLFSFLLLLSSKQAFAMAIDTATIVAGTAKLTGKIIVPDDQKKDSISVNITVTHPISGEFVSYNTFIDASGNFSIDADVETTTSLISLSTSLNPYKYLLVILTSGGVTNLTITYNADHSVKNIDVKPNMNKNDMTQCFDVMNKMIDYRSGRKPEPLYDKSTDFFLDFAKTVLSERLAVANKDSLISNELRSVLTKDFPLVLYSTFVFDYEKHMLFNHRQVNGEVSEKPDIQKIDRTYYRFLKDFKLNDSQYLYCFTFPEFQKTILQNEILNIPEIGERDIPSWLASVKAILADLIGFKEGAYYDILAANAYARQLNEEVKSLTEKQQENIAKYWKNGAIAQILLRKNQKVAELNKFKSPLIVGDVSQVPADKMLESIVAKHKGKVVVFDLWATWCAPCLEAMKGFAPAKAEFHDKNVVFVYLSNPSSPQKLWEEKIKGIGSEHYYLKGEQWDYMMEKLELEYIPSYLFYNKEGKLIHKIQSFPGNDAMKKMINDLL